MPAHLALCTRTGGSETAGRALRTLGHPALLARAVQCGLQAEGG